MDLKLAAGSGSGREAPASQYDTAYASAAEAVRSVVGAVHGSRYDTVRVKTAAASESRCARCPCMGRSAVVRLHRVLPNESDAYPVASRYL